MELLNKQFNYSQVINHQDIDLLKSAFEKDKKNLNDDEKAVVNNLIEQFDKDFEELNSSSQGHYQIYQIDEKSGIKIVHKNTRGINKNLAKNIKEQLIHKSTSTNSHLSKILGLMQEGVNIYVCIIILKQSKEKKENV